jgi:hypothetical protein
MRGIAYDDPEFSFRPFVAQADRSQSHAGADHLEGAVGDQADAHIRLHHAADRLEAWHVDAQPHRLAGLGRGVLRPQIDRARRMQADMVEVERVGEQQVIALRQRVIRAHHHDQIIGAVMKRLEAARLGLAGADADFGGAFLDAPHHLPARPLLQIDPQQFMGAEKGGEIYLRFRSGNFRLAPGSQELFNNLNTLALLPPSPTSLYIRQAPVADPGV